MLLNIYIFKIYYYFIGSNKRGNSVFSSINLQNEEDDNDITNPILFNLENDDLNIENIKNVCSKNQSSNYNDLGGNDGEDNGNESKKIYKSKTGKLIECSQWENYNGRGYSLRNLNFLDYLLIIDIYPYSEDENELSSVSNIRKGRKKNGEFFFDSQHKLYRTFYQKIRSKFPFPILAGSNPPNIPSGYKYY